jgi:hypothetical protein
MISCKIACKDEQEHSIKTEKWVGGKEEGREG